MAARLVRLGCSSITCRKTKRSSGSLMSLCGGFVFLCLFVGFWEVFVCFYRFCVFIFIGFVCLFLEVFVCFKMFVFIFRCF